MAKMHKRMGNWVDECAIMLINRTAADVKAGDVLMVDMLASSTEATAVTEGGEASIYANAILPATAGLSGAGLAGFPMVVCVDDEVVGDDKRGLFQVEGHVQVSVIDDDQTGNDVEIGSGLTTLNGAHDASAVGTGLRTLGLALEAGAGTGSAGSASLIEALWWGGRPGSGTISA